MQGQTRPTLVIMAAGMGSRFGGLKQLTSVGPSGERIIDYSVFDALRAGFDKVLFIIKREIEQDFKQIIGDGIAKYVEVSYAFQELDMLPDGFSVPEGRKKPWGTGHAILCGLQNLDGPFVAINADDFYGKGCYQLLYDFLMRTENLNDMIHIAMAGFMLENTLTENGYVSRGICKVDKDGMLTDLVERIRIEKRSGSVAFTEDDGQSWIELDKECRVSMNCWAFPSGMKPHFERIFKQFLLLPDLKLNSEFYLPYAVDCLVKEGCADVSVLETGDKWYGMTYAEDKDSVISAISEMVNSGEYPDNILS